MFNCEATNASGTARADLIVDGKVIANLSSLELLKLKSFLENPQLQEMLQNIPVRKDSEIWEPCTDINNVASIMPVTGSHYNIRFSDINKIDLKNLLANTRPSYASINAWMVEQK